MSEQSIKYILAGILPAVLFITIFADRIVLLLFGGAKLPKLARSMGQASKEFKTGLSEGAADEDEEQGKKA